MIAGVSTTPLIWPLLDKLNRTTAAQVRPKAAGNLGLVRIPAVPRDESDRPGYPWFGQVEGTPRLWELAPWKIGLAAIGVQSKRLVEFRTNPRCLPISEQRFEPAVVKPLIAGLPKIPPGPAEPTYSQRKTLIWPLLDKLNPVTAMQMRPKSEGNQGLTRLPTLPWDDADRTSGVGYGSVEGTPRLWEFAPKNFGQSVLGKQPQRLAELNTNPRALPVSEQVRIPAVIHPLKLPARVASISGITKDKNGAILGSCVVELYLTSTNEALASTVSDVNGVFFFTTARFSPATHYMVAYKAGSPDLAGTTLNTLTGS